MLQNWNKNHVLGKQNQKYLATSWCTLTLQNVLHAMSRRFLLHWCDPRSLLSLRSFLHKCNPRPLFHNRLATMTIGSSCTNVIRDLIIVQRWAHTIGPLVTLLRKSRKDMEGHVRCSSLALEREEHLPTARRPVFFIIETICACLNRTPYGPMCV
jgi:hypothetical protein